MNVESRQKFFWSPIFQNKNFSSIVASIFILSFVILGGSIAPFMYTASASGHNTITASSTPQGTPPPTPTSVVYHNYVMAQSIASQYMDALLSENYHTMWALLHSKQQAKWTSEAAFSKFWQIRFKDYRLLSYSMGNVQLLPFWIDQETMMQYVQVEKVPVSLQLEPKKPSALTQLPAVYLHPNTLFQNLPFIVQHTRDVGENSGEWYVLDGGPADLEAPLLQPTKPVNPSLEVPILMYHHISNNAPPPYPFFWTVTISNFTQQLDYLEAHNYHSITFNELFDALYYGWKLPSKPFILTFDDGLEDSYQNAYPILLAHHFSAMFYIVSGKVGWDGQMTWPQLKEMLTHGMQMGSHTINHINLAQTLIASQDLSKHELLQAQKTLQENLGIPIQHFCYPYGEPFYTL